MTLLLFVVEIKSDDNTLLIEKKKEFFFVHIIQNFTKDEEHEGALNIPICIWHIIQATKKCGISSC